MKMSGSRHIDRRSSIKYEPLANEKWTRFYEKEVKENEELERIAGQKKRHEKSGLLVSRSFKYKEV